MAAAAAPKNKGSLSKPFETVRLLRSQLRTKSRLRVIDADPLPLEQVARQQAGGPLTASDDALMTGRTIVLRTPIDGRVAMPAWSPEQVFAAQGQVATIVNELVDTQRLAELRTVLATLEGEVAALEQRAAGTAALGRRARAASPAPGCSRFVRARDGIGQMLRAQSPTRDVTICERHELRRGLALWHLPPGTSPR